MRMLLYRLKIFGLTRLIAVLSLAALVYPAPASADNLKDKTKAVFIFKLFNYVTWPKSRQTRGSGGEVLCVYGKSTFSDTLNYLKRKNPRLFVKHISQIDNISRCQLLYVGTFDKKIAAFIKTNDQGILIVSDVRKSFDNGGMIFLFYENDRLQLNINRTKLHKAGFKINSILLRHARVVK